MATKKGLQRVGGRRAQQDGRRWDRWGLYGWPLPFKQGMLGKGETAAGLS